jgi:homoserine dehydrogenase
MLNIGIIGIGTVGSSVVNILKQNKDLISSRAGIEINPIIGVVKNIDKKRDVNIKLTNNINEVLEDDSIDIVVELMGGVEESFKVIKKALANNKAIVTANKALLAYHRYEIQDLAKNIPFKYEASVAGGIPIINALKDGLNANNILSIKGIMNGTCNYMLTKMMSTGVEYEEILKESQKLGYAEADPSFDVGGFDAAHKLLILASLAYNLDAKPEDILIEGIENISKIDISFAKESNYSIKLLGIAKIIKDEIELRVHPVLISNEEMISKVDGVMNGISIIGDKVGETLYYGAGAGGDATASAVISDIINIAREDKSSYMLGYKQQQTKLKLATPEYIQTEYYIRIKVEDKSGVLAKIALIFEKYNVSIKTLSQKPNNNKHVNLLISTHKSKEKNIQNLLTSLNNYDLVVCSPCMIRIES